ncbi:MAG: hypothetical protein ABEK75_08605 [Salinibacter sp.]
MTTALQVEIGGLLAALGALFLFVVAYMVPVGFVSGFLISALGNG